ncbi:MAG TPA: FAD-dependent oxidoreductase [Kofleriaceae bacterium]|nr:FAD-dependent oxidoreductase [Kofleriaceae bacterium]
MDVTVVGAGVIGLVTALELERAGHRVQVVAAATGDATTSSVAGAIWLPYRCGPADRVGAWAAATRARLVAIAAERPEAGVDVLTGYELVAGDERPWWADAAAPVERVPAPLPGDPGALAWRFAAPRVDPPRFLAWLAAQLARPVEQRVLTGAAELAALPGDAVVNCTGLGAAPLCADGALVPLLGQVVVAELGALDPTSSIGDSREPDLFYAIPRRDTVILGGCAVEAPLPSSPLSPPPPADPAITARILAHAARLGLRPGPVLAVRVGLRPFRPSVRLERDPADPRLFHHYGHGGAGFTLSFGCAADLVALLAAPPSAG